MSDKVRTNPQNALYWKVLTELAQEMLDKGVDLKHVLRKDIPMKPTKERLHAIMGLELAGVFGKTSTTQLSTKQMSQVLETICDTVRERTNGEIDIHPNRPLTEQEAEDLYNSL